MIVRNSLRAGITEFSSTARASPRPMLIGTTSTVKITVLTSDR
jgi:hypothetical protein